MKPIAGFLVPPRLLENPWQTGSVFTVRVVSYDSKSKFALVEFPSHLIFQVRSETLLEPSEILRLVAQKDSLGQIIWKILPVVSEKSVITPLPQSWIEAFVQLGLAPKPDRIQSRMTRFGHHAEEWGAQAQARSWPDRSDFISQWAQAECALDLSASGELLPQFPQLSENTLEELQQWNWGGMTTFPILRLFPVPFSWNNQAGQGWIKTWSNSPNTVFRWTFLSVSFGLPLVLTYFSPELNLRLLNKDDESFFEQSPAFHHQLQAKIGRHLRWKQILSGSPVKPRTFGGIDVKV